MFIMHCLSSVYSKFVYSLSKFIVTIPVKISDGKVLNEFIWMLAKRTRGCSLHKRDVAWLHWCNCFLTSNENNFKIAQAKLFVLS